MVQASTAKAATTATTALPDLALKDSPATKASKAAPEKSFDQHLDDNEAPKSVAKKATATSAKTQEPPRKEAPKLDSRSDAPVDKPSRSQEQSAPKKADAQNAVNDKSAAKAQPQKAEKPDVREKQKTAPTDDVDATQAAESTAKSAGKKSTAPEDPELVKLLSGKLGEIDPSKIPSIVMGSQFISMAMTSENLQGFYLQQQPSEDLVEALNLNPSWTAKKLNGMPLPQTISPQDLFNKLGLDAQSVFAELTTLKGHLETDGLQAYVQRAVAYQQKTGKPLLNDRATLFAAQDPNAANQNIVPVPTEKQPNLHDTKFSSTPKTLPGAAGRNGFAEDKSDATSGSALNLAAGLAATANQSASFAAQDNQGLFASNGKIPLDAIRNPALENIPIFRPGSIELTKQDPFAALGKEMAPGQIFRFDPKELDLHAEEVLLPGSSEANKLAVPTMPDMRGLTPAKNPTPNFAFQAPAATPHAAEELSDRDSIKELAKALEPRSLDAAPTSAAITQFTNNNGFAADPSRPDPNVNAIPAARDLPRDSSSNSSDRDRDNNNDNTGPKTNNMHFIPKTEQHGSRQVDGPSSFQQVLKQERPNVTGPLIERAQLLVNDGGGSMRLDLGSSELGSLDIAVKVNQDTIDLRIVASSDSVRDQISQDLQNLRDSLMRQNLNLRQVEVSLSSGQQWSHNSPNNQSNGRSYEEIKEIADVTGTKSTRQAYRSQQTTHGVTPFNPQHQGKIQVLA